MPGMESPTYTSLEQAIQHRGYNPVPDNTGRVGGAFTLMKTLGQVKDPYNKDLRFNLPQAPGFGLNPDLMNRSYLVEKRYEFSSSALASNVETAGVLLIERRGDDWVVTGTKTFRKAFATETSVGVMEQAYANLDQAFLPFHTHLGHPHSFKGLARFAPTANDVRHHRMLMQRFAKSHGTGLDLPGVIFHASGEITAYWAGASDGYPIVLAIKSKNGHTTRGVTTVDDLEYAMTSGELSIKVSGEIALSKRHLQRKNWDRGLYQVVLWDNKRRFRISFWRRQ